MSDIMKPKQNHALKHFNDYAQDDRWSRWYDEIDDPNNFNFLSRRRRVHDLLGDLSNQRVFDMGCGTGSFFQELVAQGGEIVGADGALEMARMAKQHARDADPDKCRVLVSVIEQIGLSSHSVDAAICVGVIEYVENEDRAIQELIRVLKPGGTLIVTIPNAKCVDLWMKTLLTIPRQFGRSIARIFGKSIGDGKDVDRRYTTAKELDLLMTRHGCTIQDRVFYFIDIICYPLRLLSPKLSLWALKQSEPRYRLPLLRFFARGYIVKVQTPAQK